MAVEEEGEHDEDEDGESRVWKLLETYEEEGVGGFNSMADCISSYQITQNSIKFTNLMIFVSENQKIFDCFLSLSLLVFSFFSFFYLYFVDRKIFIFFMRPSLFLSCSRIYTCELLHFGFVF